MTKLKQGAILQETPIRGKDIKYLSHKRLDEEFISAVMKKNGIVLYINLQLYPKPILTDECGRWKLIYGGVKILILGNSTLKLTYSSPQRRKIIIIEKQKVLNSLQEILKSPILKSSCTINNAPIFFVS